MVTPAQTQTLTLDQFVEHYGEQGPFEYIDGEMIPVAPQVSGSGYTGGKFYRVLSTHVETQQVGIVFIETPFVLTLDKSRWVTGSRVPDVMYYSAERFRQFQAEYPDWESIPVVGAPDFVAEVVSPTDGFSDVSQKVAHYLADGVNMVWLLDWQQKAIQVHLPETNHITTFNINDHIRADPVIPGFEIQLLQLFAPPL
ncbi:MAG: hypothetical protein CL610_00100 [Anaerolineaceae bacterium]|nr:hypothetical protein [Anaerolineaceae bacterium]